jgi:4-hydroxy-3-methylbut-2-enyl diphosphate reductase IspH
MKILLAKPRGFCAGVDRAIQIVKKNVGFVWITSLCSS